MIKKRLNILLLLLVMTLRMSAGEAAKAIDDFVRTSGIAKGSVAVMVTDLSDGSVVGSWNETTPLVPASIMKSVTTAALLGETGADFRYRTPVYIDGPTDMGIVRGNLVIEGSCDPTVGTMVEPFDNDIISEITDALLTAGINKIEGHILIDESAFAGPGRPDSWQRADFSQSYGTASHAFNYANNASGKKSVENPGQIFINKLKANLSRNGIMVDNKDLGEGPRTLVAEHFSPTIDEIMRSCMMRSDNLFAESMLRTYGKVKGGDGSTTDAAAREREMWEEREMPLDDVVIIDGSGLSRSNRVTPDFMTAVLKSMSSNPYYASFFPLAGQEGTLKSFLAETPLDGYIAMKTGSMNGIQCYAGYKLDDDYVPTHTVVIMMNDINGSRDKAKKAAQRMLLEIFDDTQPANEN